MSDTPATFTPATFGGPGYAHWYAQELVALCEARYQSMEVRWKKGPLPSHEGFYVFKDRFGKPVYFELHRSMNTAGFETYLRETIAEEEEEGFNLGSQVARNILEEFEEYTTWLGTFLQDSAPDKLPEAFLEPHNTIRPTHWALLAHSETELRST